MTTPLEKFVTSTRKWILDNYGNYYRDGDKLDEFIRIQTNELNKHKIDSEYALMYIISGCFLLRCYVSHLPDFFLNILTQKKISQKLKSERFLEAVLEHMEQSHERAATE